MTLPHPRTALALIALATLAACGGGAGTDTQPLSAAQRIRALAATSGTGGSSGVAADTTPTITAQQLFTWAQLTYPELFGTATPTTISGLAFNGKIFEVRAYSTGNYLGVTNTGEAYGYGPFVGNQLFLFGPMQQYASLVCSKVDCSGNGGGTGTLNECFDPAMASPPAGFTMHLVYGMSGPVKGERTTDSTVDGTRTFEGQSATQVTTSTTQSYTTAVETALSTTTSNNVSKTYQQPTGSGMFKVLGSLDDISTTTTTKVGSLSLPPMTTSMGTKSVFNPAYVPTEFTLALGQQVTRTSTTTTTVLSNTAVSPAPGTVSTDTSSETYTFEAKESVTVPAGTYNACRYKMTSGTGAEATSVTTWYVLGKGVMAKSQVSTPAGTQVMELKPGSTYNGAPL